MFDSTHLLRRVTGRLLPLGAVLGMGLCLLPLLPLLLGGDATAQPAKAANQYIGSKKCQNCHDAEASGNQWGVWLEAGHSHAIEALSSDEAKAVAAKLGIADAAKSEQCLRCHVTGFGLPEKQFKKSFKAADGVGCESCHGPGNDHARARFRAANEEDDEDEGFGDEEEEASYTELPEGEIGMHITRELCVECHNSDSPTYKPFCFYERVEAVRHINPLKPRTAAEKAALLVCGCGETCACDHDCVEECAVPPK